MSYPSMQTALAGSSHILLAVDQMLNLVAHLLQPVQDLLVAILEAEKNIWDVRLGAELLDQGLDLAQVMSGYTGKEVVDGLELETAVDEVEPGGAVDIHGGAQLALGEGFGFAEVRGGHGPVGEGDLDVEGHGDDVRDKDESDSDGPTGKGAPEEEVTKDVPVARHHGDLSGADPPRLAASEGRGLGRKDMQPREEVEVEARDAHDRVVGVLLEGYKEVGSGVPDEGEVVVGRVKAPEERGRGGEDRDVLDIGIVLGHVGDEMVNVVTALPPTNRKTAAKVGDEHAN